MTRAREFQFDEIGYWSEVKLDIIKEYAVAYSKILSAQQRPPLSHVYVDGFAGPGLHVSRTTKEFVLGSPLNALLVDPPFHEFFLIDLDGDKVENLRALIGDQANIHLYRGDCNKVLLRCVFPEVRYEDYRRGLCLLDPYGLDLDWEVLQTAGDMGTFDMFLNFPIMDMNRNVLWRDPDRVSSDGIQRMTAFWGDDTWRSVAYTAEPGLFGQIDEKVDNYTLAEAFRQRLEEKAGFSYVPRPLPMRNSVGATVYYLFFASQKPVAKRIIQAIFRKYASRGV